MDITKPEFENVALLLDYQNVHLVGRGLYQPGDKPHRCVPDPCRIADILETRRARPSKITAVRVFRGRPDPGKQPKLAASSDTQVAQWQRDPRVHVTRRMLTYRGDQVLEKGIDVAIAVDMLHLAIRGLYDAIIIFSGDTDLMPAVETIKQLKLTHLEAACWRGSRRLRLPAPDRLYGHELTAADWFAVTQDWTGK